MMIAMVLVTVFSVLVSLWLLGYIYYQQAQVWVLSARVYELGLYIKIFCPSPKEATIKNHLRLVV
jgi:hypothetical protein